MSAPTVKQLRTRGSGRGHRAGGRGIRRCPGRAERDDRPAPEGHRAGGQHGRRDRRGPLRTRVRSRSRRSRRRPQRAGVRDVRRGRARPVGHARGARGRRGRHGARRGRRDVGRLQRRHARVRSCQHGRHHLDHRGRRPDARWWDRLPQPRARALGGQPAVGRRGHRRRTVPGGERARERGPVLGAPRRRGQLRRRDGVRVPALTAERDLRRPDVLRARRRARGVAVVPRVHRRRARGVRRVPCLPDRAAAAVHPRGAPRRHVPRVRVLLGGAGR